MNDFHQISHTEFLDGFAMHRGNRLWIRIAAYVIVTGTCLLWAILKSGEDGRPLLPYLTAPAIVSALLALVLFVLSPWFMKRNFTSQLAMLGDRALQVRYEFEGSDWIIHTPKSTARYSPADFISAQRGPNVCILYRTKALFMVIPNRLIDDRMNLFIDQVANQSR